MKFQINKTAETPLYQQIKNTIKNDILSEVLPEGYRLPSERELAEELGVHRNTVVRAYHELMDEQLVVASRKAPRGYFVCREGEVEAHNGSRFSVLDQMIKYEFLTSDNVFNDLFHASYEKDEVISFAGVVLADEDYPVTEINQLLKEAMEEQNTQMYGYCDPQGLYELRSNIAGILRERNMQTTAANIQIVSETNEAIEYIIAMYLDKGDSVLMEEPMCPDVVNSFINYGIKIIPVPMDEGGIRIDVAEQMIKKFAPKFIYTMPNFHNPTGIRMSVRRRKELLKCAAEYNVPIIEEDCQMEFNYTDVVCPSLFAMDRHGCVIHIDSSALTFFPGARIGYVAAPASVISVLRKIMSKNQIFVGSLSQYLWSKYISQGYYQNHCAALKEKYRRKRDLFCRELAKTGLIDFAVPEGGLVLWCRLPREMNDREFFLQMKSRGVLIMPGYLFLPYGNQGENYIRLSFAGATDEELVKGAGLLGETLRNLLEKEKL